MVERNLKFMKDLVRQRAHVEDSMMEGYTKSNNKFEGEQLKGKGRLRKLKGNH